MKYKKLLTLFLVLSLITTGFTMVLSDVEGIENSSSKEKNSLNKESQTVPMADYTTHEPIRIDNNTDLNDTAQSEGWPGNGSESNPYIIKGYDIDGGGHGYGIYLGNTTDHFVVRDCYLHNASGTNNQPYFTNSGLHLYNVTNGRLENNTASSNTYSGIYLDSSINNTLNNNTVTLNVNYGFYIFESNNNSVSNNIIQDIEGEDGSSGNPGEKGGVGAGIYISFASNNVVYSNTITNITGGDGGNSWQYYRSGGAGGVGAGIYLITSTDNKLFHNDISSIQGGEGGAGGDADKGGAGGVGAGIYLTSSTENNLSNNDISSLYGGTGGNGGYGACGGAGGVGAGIYLTSSTENDLSQNNISLAYGGPGGNGGDQGNEGADQVGFGIYIESDSQDNVISTSNTVNNDPIVYYYNATNITIKDYVLTNHSNPTNYGKVGLIDCYDVTVSNNTIANYVGSSGATGGYENKGGTGGVGAGIYLTNSTGNISNNVISSTQGGRGGSSGYRSSGGAGGIGTGIYLHTSTGNISNNVISSTQGGRGGIGAYMGSGGTGGVGAGIYLTSSTNNNLSYNDISSVQGGAGGNGGNNAGDGADGDGAGIYMSYSDDNDLPENTVYDNPYAVYITSSNNNTVYHNTFLCSSNQAYDDGNNSWNVSYPSGGNYWDDYDGDDNYSGPDQNQPGGDGIGDSNYSIDGSTNFDEYPLMAPYGPPSIHSTTPVSGENGVQFDRNVTVVFSESLNTSVQPILEETKGPGYSYNFNGFKTTLMENDTAVWTHTNWPSDTSINLKVSNQTDIEGNEGDNYSWAFTTKDTTPPTVSSVTVSDLTNTSAEVTWTTDEVSDSRVNYSINSDLSSNSTEYNSTMTTSHSVILTGLSPDTTYYFEVFSTDEAGNTGKDDNSSDYYTFTTKDTIPPTVTSVTVSDLTNTSAEVKWTTDEPSDSRVNYSINSDLSSNSTEYNSTMTTSHTVTLTSLSPTTTYYFEVFSTDGAGNTGKGDNNSNYYTFTTKDTTPPTVSSVTVSDLTNTSAEVTWTTDEVSDSRVNYSINSDLSSNSTEYNSTMTTSHSVILTGLSPDTTYYFEVFSTDEAGNTGKDDNSSDYYTFTTLDTTPPIITDVTTETPTTGENITLEANVTDDVAVSSVWVEYWFDSEKPSNVSMTRSTDDWTYEINKTPSDANVLHYIYHASDTSDNFDSTAELTLDVIDNDPPAITDNSQTNGTTGDTFNFNAPVTDNINVSDVYVEYWFGSDSSSRQNISMNNPQDNLWKYQIASPSNSTDTLHYVISSKDASDNWASTGTNNITVTDDDDPTADAGKDVTIYEGETVDFNGSGSYDNVSIDSYTWTFTEEGNSVSLLGVDPSYTFNTSGNYTVTLTVKDEAGNEDSNTLVVQVEASPDNPDDGESDETDEDAGFPWWILTLIALIIVSVGVVIFFIKRREPGEEEEHPDEEEGETF